MFVFWSQLSCLLVLIRAAHGSFLYSISFHENSIGRLIHLYYMEFQVNVSFPDNEHATFTTTVLNVTPLHFQLYVNDQNCGVVGRKCTFTLPPNATLLFVLTRAEMESTILSFTYRGGSMAPDILVNGCSEGLSFGRCVHGSQTSMDMHGNSFADSLCVCRGPLSTCLFVSNDSCISNHPFWSNNSSIISSTESTTRLKSTLPSTTASSTTLILTTHPITTPMESTTKMTSMTSSSTSTTTTVTSMTPTTPTTTMTTTARTTSTPIVTSTTPTTHTITVTSTTITTPTATVMSTIPTTPTTTMTTTARTTSTTPTTPTITVTSTTPTTPTATVTTTARRTPITMTPTTTTAFTTFITPSSTSSTLPTTTNPIVTAPTRATSSSASTTTSRTSTHTTTVTYSTNATSSLVTTTATPVEPLTPTLKNLSDSGVGINNVSTVLNETLVYSKMGSNLNATQVMEISTILINAANVPGLKAENSVAILKNLDNILYVSPTTMYQSGNSAQGILNCLSKMVGNTVDSRIEYLNGVNLGFSSKKIDCSNLSLDDGLLDLGTRFELINTTFSNQGKWQSILIPLSDLCSTQEISHVFFTIYRDTSLFVGPQLYRTYKGSNQPISSGNAETYTPPYSYSTNEGFDEAEGEGDALNVTSQAVPPSPCARQTSLPSTPVMSATVLNNGAAVSASSTAEATMALLRFNISTLLRPLHGNFKVTWWDVGRNKWAEDQQCEIVSNSDGVLEAKCTHLTDFAIIVDAALNDPNVCDVALITLGYVVNGFSIISLVFLTFFSAGAYIKTLANSRLYVYIRGRNLARRDFLALAYHLDLLLFYVCFTAFSNQYVSGSMCTIMAAIMYALLMCSLFLTIFQALRNIIAFTPSTLVRLLNIMLSTPSVLSISVALPFILSISLLVFTTFFDRQDCFCWVRPDYVVAAIIIPVTVLLFSTALCTSFMIYKVFCGMKRKFSQGGHHYDPNVTTKIVSIVVMQVSLGLPWVLQFGTLYSPYTTFWHYIFTIVLGSQGTILLLIFIYKRYRAWQSESMLKSRDASLFKSSDSARRKSRKVTSPESLGSSSDSFHEY